VGALEELPAQQIHLKLVVMVVQVAAEALEHQILGLVEMETLQTQLLMAGMGRHLTLNKEEAGEIIAPQRQTMEVVAVVAPMLQQEQAQMELQLLEVTAGLVHHQPYQVLL